MEHGRDRGRGEFGREEHGYVIPTLMANPNLMTSAFLANPFGFAEAVTREMDRFMSGAVRGDQFGNEDGGRGMRASGRGSRWAPQMEVRRRGDELVVCADLPGLEPDDVEIDIEDGVLTIAGERRDQRESGSEENEGVWRTERSYGAFVRSLALPEGVDEDRIEARFDNGVLEVHVPLPEERQSRSRRVEIQSGAHGRVGSGASAERGASASRSGSGSAARGASASASSSRSATGREASATSPKDRSRSEAKR